MAPQAALVRAMCQRFRSRAEQFAGSEVADRHCVAIISHALARLKGASGRFSGSVPRARRASPPHRIDAGTFDPGRCASCPLAKPRDFQSDFFRVIFTIGPVNFPQRPG
jgi:hypothetical protein